MMNTKDISYLQMAYALAEKAKGWSSPNPYVGALIVKKDVIIGHGYHEKPGTPHAEIIAIEKAGSSARDATAYITLEPCTHWGRTPPCVDRLIEARLKRVVISSLDPNPVVFKKGVKKLREAGIEVSVGLLKEKNDELNEVYIKYITRNLPFVTAKVATSLDGKIATREFDSKWISSPRTREYVHLLRGEYSSLMVGVNTILKDDPLLTVRHPHWKGKHLFRIVLDSHLRFPLKAKILETLEEGKIFIFTLSNASQEKADLLREKGVEVIPLGNFKIEIKKVLSSLANKGISSVLVEGGGRVLTSFLEEKAIDKIYVSISPKLIGGEKALTFFEGEGVRFVRDSLKLRKMNWYDLDEEIIVEGYF